MKTDGRLPRGWARALWVLWIACGPAARGVRAETVWLDELDIGLATCGWGRPRRNRSTEGRPLTIAGRTFDRGVGTHAPGIFRIRLGGAGVRFTALVGVDDEVAARPSKASLEFQVVGDGKTLWASGLMRRRQPAKQVDVKLDGVKLLDLVVTDGGDGLACDHADWANARFELAGGARIAAVKVPSKRAKARWPAGRKHQPESKVVEAIDLGALTGRGTKVRRGFAGKPDTSPWGVLATYELRLGSFAEGVFYAHATPGGWPNMMNRGYPFPFRPDAEAVAQLHDGGIFLLLHGRDGGYLAVAALAGAKTQSWFHTDRAGRMLLSFGTFGTAAVECDAPLLAWGRSADVYAACHGAYAAAAECAPLRGGAVLRGAKGYPECLRYLGWCSWEHFHGRIDEASLLGAVDGIEASGLPVRYVLVDDGHTSTRRGAISSFRPNGAKFPNGWSPLLKRRRRDGIRWMGLWHDFKGYHNGVAPENDFGEELNGHLEEFSKTSLTVRNDPRSSLAFYRAFMGSVAKHGFDFVKTDFQSAQLRRLSGKVDNAVERCVNHSRAFEAALKELRLDLINCNWHNPANFLNCRTSSVGRCSIDYSKNSAASARRHLLQSYANILWLGQLAWGDHDMFHSSHEGVGGIMAVSKAMSGGPVYLSDNPKDFVAAHVTPLCYADGRLLRPLAPAAPLPDSIFVDPVSDAAPYRVVAPLPGRAAAVVVYNLSGNKQAGRLRSGVSADDYRHAGGMLQPYEGKWPLPGEGLVVYDRRLAKARRLAGRYTFELDGFADRLLLLLPVRKGWAAIGRTDKYLSPAAVEVVSASRNELKLRLAESGPLAVWSERGAPRADGVRFADAGNGLYTADLPVQPRPRTVTIRR